MLLFLTLSLYITTKLIELKNIDLLKSTSEVQLIVDKNNNIGVPQSSDIAIFNHKLSKAYWVINLFLSFSIPFFMFYKSFSWKLEEFSLRKGKGYFWSAGIYLIIFYSIYFMLKIPLMYFSGFYKAHLIGISNESIVSWAIDLFKSYVVNLVTIFLLGWIPFAIINKTKTYWWLIIGALSIPFYALSTLIYPLYIDPLFNDFKPIEDKNIEFKIKEMATRIGIEDLKLYQVDKSKETKAMNAYMTGIMGNKQIVLWDNTLNGLEEREVLVVAAHEMGHYALGHIPKSIIAGSVFTTAVLFFTNLLSGIIINRFKKMLNITNIKDLSAIPIIIFTIMLFNFLLSPISNAYTRYQEVEADRFAIELTKDNYANASIEVKFLQNNISVSEVSPLYKILRYDHPTPKERIIFSNNYKPWEKGERLKYEKYFKY